MFDYSIFQPSTGGYVCSFSVGSAGGSVLGFTELSCFAVHGSKHSMQALLDTVDFERPSLAETLMIVRFDKSKPGKV